MRILCKLRLPLLLASLIFLLAGCGSSNMTLTFPLSGYSECAILQYEDYTILIDAGDSQSSKEILSTLNQLDVSKIDALILTNNKAEHIGGAADIIASIPVTRVIGNEKAVSSSQYTAYLTALSNAGLTEEIPDGTLTLEYGKLKITVDSPTSDSYESDRVNNMSSIVSVSFRKTNYLFTSDIETERADEYIAAHKDGTEYDVITLPDHGQEADTAVMIFERYSNIGTTGIISSSPANPENSEILDELPTTGIFLSREGSITVTNNGRHVSVSQN